jgi:predicted nucleotidyltransferase
MTQTLASVLFSDYRRRVLGLLLLHPDKAWHLREVARMTDTVPGTLARELAKLTQVGILQRETVGRQVLFSANRDCPIYDELASVLRKTSGLVDVLADALLPMAEEIDEAFVFGSMASGQAHAGSDVDVMVIGRVSFERIVEALYPAQEVLGREINPKVFGRDQWQSLVADESAFVQEVISRPKLQIMGHSI